MEPKMKVAGGSIRSKRRTRIKNRALVVEPDLAHVLQGSKEWSAMKRECPLLMMNETKSNPTFEQRRVNKANGDHKTSESTYTSSSF